MTAARAALAYTASGVVPYTTHPIALLPIPLGTYANTTHVSSTFLCRGCINSDSFDPAWAADNNTQNRDVFFGYAFSQTAVASPSDNDTALSPHTGPDGGYGAFRISLAKAKSDQYDKYAAMAEQPGSGATSSLAGVVPTATTETPAATPTGQGVGNGCLGAECERPAGVGYRKVPRWEVVVMVVLGGLCLVQDVLF
jgi:hypothetical protein